MEDVVKAAIYYCNLSHIICYCLIWVLIGFLGIKYVEKGIKSKISSKMIHELREKKVFIRIGSNGNIVYGVLWDFPEKGILLKKNGEIFVFWDDISWIEVIEKIEEERLKENEQDNLNADLDGDCL